jgi:hypothetical protein
MASIAQVKYFISSSSSSTSSWSRKLSLFSYNFFHFIQLPLAEIAFCCEMLDDY